MATNTVKQFIEALHKLEAERDVEPMAQLYAAEAEVGNIIAPEKFHGPAGAREFWTKYRETFAAVESSFRHCIVSEDCAALEWTTKGTTPSGNAVEYDGVSILEIVGDKIVRFRAYFDSKALSRQVAGPPGAAA